MASSHELRYKERRGASPGEKRKQMKPRELRRVFLVELWTGLKLVWPVMSGLVGTMLALGLVIGWREGPKKVSGTS